MRFKGENDDIKKNVPIQYVITFSNEENSPYLVPKVLHMDYGYFDVFSDTNHVIFLISD